MRDTFVSATFRKTAGARRRLWLIIRDQQPATRDGVDQSGSYYPFEVSDRGEYGVWRRDGDHWSTGALDNARTSFDQAARTRSPSPPSATR